MKTKLLSLITLPILLLTGCNNTPKDEIAPEIDGVAFEATCKVGDSYDLLKDITAYDDVDGDITDKIKVTILPTSTFEDYIFIPEHVGEYEICYSVSDSAGNSVQEYTSLTVEPGYSPETLYKKIDLNQCDMNGWQLLYEESITVETSLIKGSYSINVTNSTLNRDDIVFTKDYEHDAECEYELHLSVTSSVAGTFYVNDAEVTLVEGENEVSAPINTVGAGDIIAANVQLGSLAETFTFTINSLDLIIAKGVAADSDLLETFDMTKEGVTYISTGNQAEASLTNLEAKSATINIVKGPQDRGCWNIRLFVNTGIKLSEGNYTVSIDVISDVAYSEANGGQFELMLNAGAKEKGFDGQGEIYGYKLPKDTKRTLTCELDVKSNKDELIFMFQLGQIDNGASNINFTVSDPKIIAHDGNRLESHDVTNFLPTGFEVHNSEDVGASGEAYIDNGSLVYHVTQFGNVDWNNKIVIKDILLEEGSIYTVKINMTSSNPIKANIFFNSGEWNPVLALYDYQVGTTNTTIEAKTTDALSQDGIYELLFQVGQNSTVGETYIIINSIEIYSSSLIN